MLPVPGKGPDPSDDYDGHGTCVASLAVGNILGVSRHSKLVCVQAVEEEDAFIDIVDMDFVVDSFNTAIKNIVDKNRKGKSVLNWSYGTPLPSSPYSISH